ncbi:TorF family putative porin [Caulobacter sp. 17J80-11]|uniref:TorF family putative porin n=1 Tax=Caulobacter sp. 17J80-11 TaxID=2763502 RepID=UPI001653BF04|nr:TorF family putative porin [Caulobacter sp. 17J80-11]MBC6981613.1 hypothetical protein [Caulobacter sp. 17J80-11]
MFARGLFALILTSALGLWAGAALARAPELSVNLGAASDYVYRGVSQTDGAPQAFAGADLEGDAWYAGAWASNVDFGGGDPTSAEVDLYAGWRPEAFGLSWDVGAALYAYPDKPAGADYDYLEARLSAEREIGPATFGAALAWAPAYFGGGEATYVEVVGGWEISDRLGLGGGVARQTVEGEDAYVVVNLGLTWSMTERVSLDLRGWAADANDLGAAADPRVVVTLKAEF